MVGLGGLVADVARQGLARLCYVPCIGAAMSDRLSCPRERARPGLPRPHALATAPPDRLQGPLVT